MADKPAEHTAEPWNAYADISGAWDVVNASEARKVAVVYGGRRTDGISTSERHANARRIVACINACKGIPTEVLESAEVVITRRTA